VRETGVGAETLCNLLGRESNVSTYLNGGCGILSIVWALKRRTGFNRVGLATAWREINS